MRLVTARADSKAMPAPSCSDTSFTTLSVGADMRPVYTIDEHDRIAAVNDAWLRFMQLTSHAAAADMIGRSIWELIGGGETRQLWELLYGRVRSVRGQLFVPMRVDTVDERRLIDIELRPLADRAIQHICEPIWTEARPPVALLDPARTRDQRILRRCTWCARIEVKHGSWEEAEDAQSLLAIHADRTLPALQTVACVTCKQSLLATFPMAVPRPTAKPAAAKRVLV